VVVVIDVVVEVVGVHAGSVGSVQEQFGFVLHSSITALLQALKAMPVKAPHAELISSAQDFLLHAGGAAVATEKTKTPVANATAANGTTTFFLAIVEPPLWPFPCATSTRRTEAACPPLRPLVKRVQSNSPVGTPRALLDRASWAPFATRLAGRGHQVLAINFRGYGRFTAGTDSPVKTDYCFAGRHPAACASAFEQNHRSPRVGSIIVLS
jgi:hypothetical protein